MRITLSVIKADIGSIGGHIAPSQQLLSTVREQVAQRGKGLLLDHYISYTGDDIAIVMTHTRGATDACRKKPPVLRTRWSRGRAVGEPATRQLGPPLFCRAL